MDHDGRGFAQSLSAFRRFETTSHASVLGRRCMVRLHVFGLMLMMLAVQAGVAQVNGFGAYWPFEIATGTSTKESSQQVEDQILGNFTFTGGVRAEGIKFGGFTTRIARDSHSAPVIEGAATFEAWIAPQTYPWN